MLDHKEMDVNSPEYKLYEMVGKFVKTVGWTRQSIETVISGLRAALDQSDVSPNDSLARVLGHPLNVNMGDKTITFDNGNKLIVTQEWLDTNWDAITQTFMADIDEARKTHDRLVGH